jgi:hypothetical protein
VHHAESGNLRLPGAEFDAMVALLKALGDGY